MLDAILHLISFSFAITLRHDSCVAVDVPNLLNHIRLVEVEMTRENFTLTSYFIFGSSSLPPYGHILLQDSNSHFNNLFNNTSTNHKL